MRPLCIFGWHVHGSYTNALVQGPHTYLLASLPGKGPYGLGRADTWRWPDTAVNVSPQDMANAEVDVVLLQRPEELALTEAWLGGRRIGVDVPAIYLEHNAPQGRINEMRHPLADRDDVVIVHVTHFNALFWDSGSTRKRVIEHGVPDPGHLYSGEVPHAAVVINEPVRRARVTGSDLLDGMAEGSGVPIDLFGMKSEPMHGTDIPQWQLHREMARRRLYLHTSRWTSLGLSLLEAMTIGMPVVALSTTEAAEVLPSDVGTVSNDLDKLQAAMRSLVEDSEEAALTGKRARAFALERFGLARFLEDWNAVFADAVS